MNNIYLSEEAIHYAAAFLERWEDKAPNDKHRKAQKDLRAASNYLLEHLHSPAYILVVRFIKE